MSSASDPSRRLLETVRRFAEGDFAARTGIDAGSGNLAVLAAALDELGEKLEASERQESARRRRSAMQTLSLGSGGVREMGIALAHDLSQPLSVILTYATGSTPDAPPSGPQRPLREVLDIIAVQAGRVAQSLRALKDAMRRDPATWRPVDVNDLIREVLDLFSAELHARDVALRLDLSSMPGPVLADAGRLTLVVMNLVHNALDAMDSPPRELRIETARRDPANLEIRFHDSGPGFAPEMAERIFDRFFTTRPGRLGMGLAISRSVVEAHGGQLLGVTERLRGATFTIRIPTEDGG